MSRLILATVIAVILGACANPDNSEPPAPLQKFDAQLQVLSVWRAKVSSHVNLFSFNLQPYIFGEQVFVIDHKGNLSALSQKNGSVNWRKQLRVDVSAAITGDQNKLYIGTKEGELLALSMLDGSVAWRAKMTSEIIAIPKVHAGELAARSIDGRVSLFSVDDGNEKWTYSFSVPALTLRGNSSISFTDKSVIVGLDNGRLVALDTSTGVPQWDIVLSEPTGRTEFERLSDIDAEIHVDEGEVFASAFQGQIARISPNLGRIVWAQDLSSVAGFSLTDDALFVTDTNSELASLDKTNGQRFWTNSQLRARHLTAPVVFGDYIAVGDLQGYVHWLSRFSGKLVARYRIDKSRIISALAVSDQILFVQTEYGSISALKILEI
ncbi:MAG: outer membrane protein assembly factor BamB [Pseudomonadota bacterium]